MKLDFHGDTIYIDKEFVDMINWESVYKAKTGYLYLYEAGRYSTAIHRLVKGRAPRGMVVDHINRNKLDNRRKNLRFVTRKDNFENCDKYELDKLMKLFYNYGS